MFSNPLRYLLSAAVSCLALYQAEAASTIVLQEGDNHLPQYAAVTATFTPENDCKVLIEAEDQYNVTYNDQNYSFSYIPTNTPANVCEIDGVTAGTTITLSSDFVMSSLVRITTYASGSIVPIEVNNVYPATGTSDFWNNNGILSISFNKVVTLTNAQLIVGETKANIGILHVDSSISLDMGPVLINLLEDGTLKPGDRFQVTINGLCEASNHDNLYNGTGVLNLRFVAPEPQYKLLEASVNGETLSTSGLNSYSFLSYYAPDGTDGLFVLEFGADVLSVENAVIQMGSRDLDAEGKYYEGTLPVMIEGNKVYVDARGVLRTLSILFPTVVEEEPEPGETTGPGMGEYDKEHLTLRVSNVRDINGNYFKAEQAGNVGSYSFYMNYKELMETINFDGDNKMAGEEVFAGEEIRLWLGNENVRFDGILVSYIEEVEEEAYETRSVLQEEYTTEPDPYEGIIISFIMPSMPNVAAGQSIRVSLYNATSTDGMPHDLSIEYKAGGNGLRISKLEYNQNNDSNIYSLNGQRLDKASIKAGQPVIMNGRVIVYSK